MELEYKKYYCQYCNKEIKRACSLAIHERVCKFNPNRKPWKILYVIGQLEIKRMEVGNVVFVNVFLKHVKKNKNILKLIILNKYQNQHGIQD